MTLNTQNINSISMTAGTPVYPLGVLKTTKGSTTTNLVSLNGTYYFCTQQAVQADQTLSALTASPAESLSEPSAVSSVDGDTTYTPADADGFTYWAVTSGDDGIATAFQELDVTAYTGARARSRPRQSRPPAAAAYWSASVNSRAKHITFSPTVR